MYDPITVFLIAWGLFSVDLFLLLYFLPGEASLAFVVKLVWWCWILLTSACLENFWFLDQIWRRVLLGGVFLVCRFFPFITLNMPCHSLLTCRVSIEKSADSLMGVPLYVICHFSFVAFNMLSVFNFCQFDYYVSQCVPPWIYLAWDSVLPGLGWLFPFPS